MPVTPTYPGIYVQEAPSSSHTIISAPTNIAVFIGYTHPLKTNPANFGVPVEIFGFSDYQRQFGGFVRSGAFANAYDSAKMPGAFGDLAQAVNQFFLNGGTDAFVVSVNQATSSSILGQLIPQPPSVSGIVLSPPSSPPLSKQIVDIGGVIFAQLEVTDEIFAMSVVVRPAAPTSPPAAFGAADIILTYGPSAPGASPPSIAASPATTVETYRRVSLDPTSPNYILSAMAASSLVSVSLSAPAPRTFTATGSQPTFFPVLLSENAQFFSASDFTAVLQEDTPLDKLQVFNLMVLPGIADNGPSGDSDVSGVAILSAAVAFCEKKRAFLVMDPPVRDSADGTVPPGSHMIQLTAGDPSLTRSKNAALYFPYLLSPDPITGSSKNLVTGNPSEIPPAATVAGIYAATDLARGVWKAPAGFQATANNVTGVVARGAMTDNRQGVLNPLGVNCLRDFPNVPTIVFGARTLATTYDQQWTYVSVRRMALFLEQTLYANLKWVLFEPNADPLWSAISMSINAFMLGLFKQGAFQGDTPSQAFSVRCDSQTTTQADIDSGIVNIVVGFAPLKPAEFVIITIAQLAGQASS
jgi:hypothetical protein